MIFFPISFLFFFVPILFVRWCGYINTCISLSLSSLRLKYIVNALYCAAAATKNRRRRAKAKRKIKRENLYFFVLSLLLVFFFSSFVFNTVLMCDRERESNEWKLGRKTTTTTTNKKKALVFGSRRRRFLIYLYIHL